MLINKKNILAFLAMVLFAIVAFIGSLRSAAVNTSLSEIATSNIGVWFIILFIGTCGVGVFAHLIVFRTTDRLNSAMARYREAMAKMADATNALSQSAQSYTESVTRQAVSLKEMSSALRQIPSIPCQDVDNTTPASKSTGQTLERTNHDAKTIGNISSALRALRDSTQTLGHIAKIIAIQNAIKSPTPSVPTKRLIAPSSGRRRWRRQRPR